MDEERGFGQVERSRRDAEKFIFECIAGAASDIGDTD